MADKGNRKLEAGTTCGESLRRELARHLLLTRDLSFREVEYDVIAYDIEYLLFYFRRSLPILFPVNPGVEWVSLLSHDQFWPDERDGEITSGLGNFPIEAGSRVLLLVSQKALPFLQKVLSENGCEVVVTIAHEMDVCQREQPPRALRQVVVSGFTFHVAIKDACEMEDE